MSIKRYICPIEDYDRTQWWDRLSRVHVFFMPNYDPNNSMDITEDEYKSVLMRRYADQLVVRTEP